LQPTRSLATTASSYQTTCGLWPGNCRSSNLGKGVREQTADRTSKQNHVTEQHHVAGDGDGNAPSSGLSRVVDGFTGLFPLRGGGYDRFPHKR